VALFSTVFTVYLKWMKSVLIRFLSSREVRRLVKFLYLKGYVWARARWSLSPVRLENPMSCLSESLSQQSSLNLQKRFCLVKIKAKTGAFIPLYLFVYFLSYMFIWILFKSFEFLLTFCIEKQNATCEF